MTQTTFTDNVLVDGSQDIQQLRVQGHTTQNQPLQTWEDSAATALAQVTGDGRLQVGDDVGLPSPDALIEAHRADTSTSKPKRGFHSLGRVSGTLATLVQWIVQELELKGSSNLDALHTALRVRLSNLNTGTPTANAELRGGDIEVINDATAGASAVPKATGLQVAVTNGSGKAITDAAALRLKMNNAGTITNPYAIYAEGPGVTHLEDYVEVKRPAAVPGTPATDFMRFYPKSDGKLYAKNWSGTEYDLTAGGSGGVVTPSNTCNGRLTLSSGVPIPTIDVSAATILYFTPHKGDKVALYDGVQWQLDTLPTSPDISIKLTDTQNGNTTNGSALVTGLTDTSQMIVGMAVTGTGIPAGATIASINSSTQVNLSVNATATNTGIPLTFKVPHDKNVDVFIFDNAGTPKLEFGPLWTNDTTRATNIAFQNGVYVKSGTPTRRYLGTMRTTATDGQTEDSNTRRFVWNYENRVTRRMQARETANSWAYTSTIFRSMNNNIANRIEFIIGVAEFLVDAFATLTASTATNSIFNVGIGLDSTSVDAATDRMSGLITNTNSAIRNSAGAWYSDLPAAGYHFLQALEAGNTGVTMYGDDGGSIIKSGIRGTVYA